MKRPKFKVWDKQGNCWYQPVYQAYEGKLHCLMIGLSGDFMAHTMAGIEHESCWPNDRYDLVQYTGLEDKHGREIYQGDIVLHDRTVLAHDYNGEPAFPEYRYIRWGHITIRPSCGVTINGHRVIEDYATGETIEMDKWNGNPGCYAEFAEVIGNIYENPELLGHLPEVST